MFEIENNWKDYEEWKDFTKFPEGTKSVHCDTRDFGVNFTDIEKKVTGLEKMIQYKDRFFMTEQEVLEVMKDLYTKSGGESEWRMITFNDALENKKWGMNWQFKYLRFLKTEHGWVIRPDNRCYPKYILKLPLNEELLSTH